MQAARRGRLRQIAKVAQQLRAAFADDRFRMELHAPERARAVHQRHHQIVVAPGDLDKIIGQRALHGERMIARCQERRWQALQQAGLCVAHGRCLAMDRAWRADHRPTQHGGDALMAEADAEDRLFAVVEHVGANAEIIGPARMTGAGRDDDIVESHRPQARPVAGVMAQNEGRLLVHYRDQMHEVVGEGVIIVDDQGAHLSLWAQPMIMRQSRARRGSSRRMASAEMAMQPAVGAGGVRVRWKKMALPPPLIRGRWLWSRISTTS